MLPNPCRQSPLETERRLSQPARPSGLFRPGICSRKSNCELAHPAKDFAGVVGEQTPSMDESGMDKGENCSFANFSLDRFIRG